MKKKLIILLSSLLILGSIGIIYKTNARRGRRGRVGFGIGVGVGIGAARHHYRRPWYRRPYYGAGAWLGYPTREYSNWRDSQNKKYWRITNNSDSMILVSSDSSSKRIAPGKSRKLYRDRSFVFTVKNLDTNLKKPYETSNHSVKIGEQIKMLSNIN